MLDELDVLEVLEELDDADELDPPPPEELLLEDTLLDELELGVLEELDDADELDPPPPELLLLLEGTLLDELELEGVLLLTDDELLLDSKSSLDASLEDAGEQAASTTLNAATLNSLMAFSR